jgi:hypothetical protein
MQLGRSPVFHYSLQRFVAVFYFNAVEIFLLEPKERGGGGRELGLFYFQILSGVGNGTSQK